MILLLDFNFSVVDAFDPDLKKYPLFKKSFSILLEQLPGEMLFIPSGWFHQVSTQIHWYHWYNYACNVVMFECIVLIPWYLCTDITS